MLVRTYGRRPSHHRSATSGASSGAFDFPLSPASSQEDDLPLSSQEPFSASQDPLLLLTQESAAWAQDDDDTEFGERRKDAVSTATLMEAQEYGEMMEHVDEVVFALDGLRPNQPPRVRRASMLSLLSASATPRQRRLLRAQGLARRIIDSILALDVDDAPCSVAAAALFFVLASDIQDDYLLDSPTCITFLLKLLNPVNNTARNKVPSAGSKLLGICKAQSSNSSYKGLDLSSEEIFLKVEEILISCKEMRPSLSDEYKSMRPELSSKWIALLTMEKACLSAVSFEDAAEVVRRVGGNFKERLRELGGLDAIFEEIVSCHTVIESFVKNIGLPKMEKEKGAALRSVALLLKCLKIMENATFLSKDNQDHLLGLSMRLKPEAPAVSFVWAVLSIIELLSALSLSKSSIGCLKDNESQSSEVHLVDDSFDGENATLSHCQELLGFKMNNSIRHKRQKCSPATSDVTIIDLVSDSTSSDAYSPSMKIGDAPSTSCNGTSKSFLGVRHTKLSSLKLNVKKDHIKPNSLMRSNGWISLNPSSADGTFNGNAKRTRPSESLIESQEDLDPFAFDECEMGPSKWELLANKKRASREVQESSRKMGSISVDEFDLPVVHNVSSQSNCNSNHDLAELSSCPIFQEDSILFEDCLLTSVKALMNLTNDNPIGCQQIGACGGLDTMALLIAKHFPSFNISKQTEMGVKGKLSLPKSSTRLQLNDGHMRDHELDFLVAILGLLVNLVEKDSDNRGRLASARVTVDQPSSVGNHESPKDLIDLLCFIFLSNQGAGEAAGAISLDDEDSMLEGQREAENMIVEAYAALLLAFLSTESSKVREAIAGCLPDNSLKVLVPVLERFVAFHLTLNMISPETHAAVTKVIESCKKS